MKLGAAGSEDRKKAIAVGGFVLIAAGLLYYELGGSGGSAPAPPAAPVIVTAPAGTVGGPAVEEGDATGAGGTGAVGTGNAAGGTAAKSLGTTSAALDPTLHMDAMLVSESVEYAGFGRNIFSPNSTPPPVVIPKPVAQARPTAPPVPVAVVPCPPNCPPPPPPPPIDLKLFGIETAADGTRQAFLLHDDNVYLAGAGDVVMRRYRVVSVEVRSAIVEDMQNNNKQTLPLLAN
jgi:hypothetical protein